MPVFYPEVFVYFFSSLISLALVYFQTPRVALQQIIAVLLVALLIILYKTRRFSSLKGPFWKFISLFIISFLVQLLVLVTGGFYSPFLILIHLFVLGAGFLLRLSSSFVFLGLTFIVLVLSIVFNADLLQIFKQDPGSMVLYVSSFVVIVPLCSRLVSSYQIKDTISKMLSDYIQMNELRERSILTGLNEFVIITDNKLNIVYANEAMEKAFGLTDKEVIGKPILEVLTIKDYNNFPPTAESLSISSVLVDKVTHIVEGFHLYKKNQSIPTDVTIQVRPVTSLEGKIDQLVFVIYDARSSGSFHKRHLNIEQTALRYQELLEDFKRRLALLTQMQNLRPYLNPFRARIEFIDQMGHDLMSALDLRDHPIDEKLSLQDVSILCKKIVAQKQGYAQSLGVKLEFSLPARGNNWPARNSGMINQGVKGRVYSNVLPIKVKWVTTLVEKLVDLSLLLSSGTLEHRTLLSFYPEDQRFLLIRVGASCPPFGPSEQMSLFAPYYGVLAEKTNLRFGSGLEGFLAKSISLQLGLPLEVTRQEGAYPLVFQIKIPKVIK